MSQSGTLCAVVTRGSGSEVKCLGSLRGFSTARPPYSQSEPASCYLAPGSGGAVSCNNEFVDTPVTIPGITTAKSVQVVDGAGGCALLQDKTLQCWGQIAKMGYTNAKAGACFNPSDF